MFENAERIGENAILMHFHNMVLDIRSFGEPENIQTTNYIYMIFQQCGITGCPKKMHKEVKFKGPSGFMFECSLVF